MSIRAAVIPAPGLPVEIREFEEPKPEPGAVLLRTLAAEVCGTDVHLWHGRLAGVPYPLLPGHVSVGAVQSTGGDVRDVDGRVLSPGDEVTFLDVHETCHNCWYCLVAKASTRCPSRKVYGITYGAKDGLLGGWSERIYLKPGVKIVSLRAGVTPSEWIAGGCGLPTALHAIDRGEIRLGDRVLIQGAGPVGLNAIVLALASGAGWVGVVDSVPARLETARLLGADTTFALSNDTVRDVKSATSGRGADLVIEATGNPAAVPQGCELTRDGGRYVIVGHYTDGGTTPINPHTHINKKHLEIRGCWGSDLSHVYRAMDVMARFGKRFQWEEIVTGTYGLAEVGHALQDVETRRVVKAVIVP